MPGTVRAAVPVETLPFYLSTQFTESHALQINITEYPDGSCQRGALVTQGRRSWKIAKRLTATQLEDLYQFFVRNRAKAFYFYNPSETLPPFSHSPTGSSGQYIVRFASDWGQTNGMVRSDASIEIIEVASGTDIAGSSGTTTAGVPTSGTLYLTSAHIPSPDFTPNYGAGASTEGVGFIFPTPNWFHGTGAWTTRTDTMAIDGTSIGSLFVLCMLEQDGSAGPIMTTPDQFFIYDCYATITYGDGTAITYRPTGFAVDTSFGGSAGSVTNPENALDANPSTFALMSCTQYPAFFGGIFLNLNSFKPA